MRFRLSKNGKHYNNQNYPVMEREAFQYLMFFLKKKKKWQKTKISELEDRRNKWKYGG